MAAVAEHTFAGWVTGSVHHNITGILFSSLVNHSMICVQMRYECLTSLGSLSCSPWKAVCHDWTATNATHSCMPGCESILAVNSKLVDLGVWILFMWYQKLKASCLVVFRDEETFETAAAMLSRESRTNSLMWEVIWFYLLDIFWSNVTEHIYSTIWHSAVRKTLKLNMFWDLLSSGVVCSIKW